MAQNDWQPLDSSLTDDQVLRGVTAGVAPPSGGGSHVYGMRSVSVTAGVLGLYCKQTNFSPTLPNKGGRISGALRRPSLGALDGFAPFLFFCAAEATVNASAYMLGLSNEASSHIELRKGVILNGLPPVSVLAPAASPNVLMRSTDTFGPDTWQHLRLDVVVQGTGDVILQVLRNDLSSHSVSSPVWQTVPGMEGTFSGFAGFVDDQLGVNTGSIPLTGGYIGFGARFETSGRAAYFDQIAVDRQL